MGISDYHMEILEFLGTNTGDHNLLLGTDWLVKHNPSIDWFKNEIALDRCPNTCHKGRPKRQGRTVSSLQILPTFEWEDQIDDRLDFTGDAIGNCLMPHLDKFEEYHQFNTPHVNEQICLMARTTISMTLAKGIKAKQEDIPVKFRQFS